MNFFFSFRLLDKMATNVTRAPFFYYFVSFVEFFPIYGHFPSKKNKSDQPYCFNQ
jgi:hypothetical protein